MERVGLRIVAAGMTGSNGPALGIDSPTRTQVVQPPPAQTRSIEDDGTIVVQVSRRLASASTNSYQPLSAPTPLKTEDEKLKGKHIDAVA